MGAAGEGAEQDGGDLMTTLASVLPYTGGVAFFALLLGALLLSLGTLIRKLL